MTIPTMTGLQIALRGLMANQVEIDTTGQNIANETTPGYSRQAPILEESDPLDIPAFSNVTGAGVQLGTGVDVSTITRIRDQFIDVQYRAQNATENFASAKSGILGQIQSGLAEPSDHGLAAQLQAFWKSWGTLADAPTSQAARTNVVNAGQAVAQTIQAIDTQLTTIQSQAQVQFQTLTGTKATTGADGQVITDAQQIAALNASISQATAAGQSPNNLLDQRDNLIDDLSSLAGVSVSDAGNGMVSVTFGGAATPLVDGTKVTWPQSLGANPGGRLGALQGLYAPGGQIDGYISQLNQVASDLTSTVNALQPASSPFFSGTTAASIRVVGTAAGLQTSSSGAAGGNDLALSIAGLTGGKVDQDYAGFVAQVGSDVQVSQSTQQTAQAVLAAVSNQRQAVSGVSLDEEMTNLVTYQRGYQACARVMNTLDSVLNTLISSVGT